MIRELLKKSLLYDLYIFLRSKGLREEGWFKSLRCRLPVDRDGQPLPWYTYPAIRAIEPRLRDDLAVFEFGSGNSTLWWASRARAVRSVEHDEDWYLSMKNIVPANVDLVHRSLGDGSYAAEVLAGDELFDVIIIDGVERNECGKLCLQRLKDDGVVIWDNTERPDYEEGLSCLDARGFRRLDLWGLSPGIDLMLCTSILYRSDNCLGL